MNRRTILHSTIAAAAVVLFCRCAGTSSYEDKTISFSQLTVSRSYSLEDSATDFQSDKDLTLLDSASMLIPDVVCNKDVRALQDSIFSIAFDSIGADHRKIALDYFDKTASELNYKAIESSDDSISIVACDGFTVISGTVNSLTPEMLVYCVTCDSYMPRAAHGISTRRYVNYSIGAGKVITLTDIFTPEGLKELPGTIADRARDLSAVFGPTEVTAIPAGGNFYISTSGEIVFVYQQYEVASFAQGIISVPFYPYELSSFMTAGGLRMFGLDQFAD